MLRNMFLNAPLKMFSLQWWCLCVSRREVDTLKYMQNLVMKNDYFRGGAGGGVVGVFQRTHFAIFSGSLLFFLNLIILEERKFKFAKLHLSGKWNSQRKNSHFTNKPTQSASLACNWINRKEINRKFHNIHFFICLIRGMPAPLLC